jgi:NAD(P)-dependent dehydrogenase (short-subunit alcohol dehydrogenase family)
MMDSLAADLKGSGVRLNSILPSIIDTEANRKAMPGADFNEVAEAGGDRARHRLSMHRRCQGHSRSSYPSLWR